MPLDSAAGIFISLGVAHLFGGSASVEFVALGVLFSLFPDIDVLTFYLPHAAQRRLTGNHRMLPHYPLVELVLSIAVGVIFGVQIGVLFFACVFFHLLHDTFFVGPGIRWIWPVSKTAISVCHDKNGHTTSGLLLIPPEREAQILSEYKTDHWIRRFYFRPSIVSCTEYPPLILALIALWVHFS